MSPETPYFLNHRRWCHLANELKPYCKQAKTTEFSTSVIAIVSMQQGYSSLETKPYVQFLLST